MNEAKHSVRSAKDRLVVALDVETGKRALELVDGLRGAVGMFKIGKQLFTAEGPELVRRIVGMGEHVFLDLKYHDIPATVSKACVEATRLGVAMLNVHASGGSEMLKEAARAVAETASTENRARPILLAVTVLTSLDDALLAEVGVAGGAATQVVRLAQLAESCGIDGVVASPLEIGLIRSEIASREFVVLTPGIRPAGGDAGDQRRITTPADAVAAGADYIVVGRPITASPDPRRAAEAIAREAEAGLGVSS